VREWSVVSQRLIAKAERAMRGTWRRLGATIAVLFSLMPLGQATAMPVVFEAAGPNAGAIQSSVDAFRTGVGNPNNANAPGPLPGGRREINWDGGGQATTISPTPFTGFLDNRGALFTTSGSGFIQAPPSGLAATFNNPTYSTFATFSDPRLFSPIGSTVTNVAFFTPGTNGGLAANITAFGAVFSDVDSSANASLRFVGADGVSRGTFSVPAANDGLSFLGVIFPGELIGEVQIVSGNSPLGPNDGGAIDIIPMDDFLYSEPSPVPEPTTLLLLATGVAGVGGTIWRQRRRRE
jgi:PEP-CTERM motif